MASEDRPLPAAAPLRIGAWRVQAALDELHADDGSIVKLEPRVMQLLLELARQPGEVVTPEALLDSVWKDVVVTPSSVYKAVAQLRRALGDDSEQPRYIGNVPRKGYRLLMPVRPADEGVAAPPIVPATSPPAEAVPAPVRTLGWRRRAWVALAAGTGVVASVAAVQWWRSRLTSGPAPTRLVVLPFSDQSEPADLVLATGLTDEVQAALERAAGFQVSARSASLRLAAQGQHASAIAERLGASHIVRGAVRRLPGAARLSIEVSAADNPRPLWSASFERGEAQLAGLGDEVARALLSALGLSTRLGPVPTGSARSFAALESYFMGVQQLRLATPEATRTARDHFKRAIDHDGNFANAWAALALGWMAAKDFEGLPLREAVGRAQPFIAKALALDEQSATAHAVQGYVYLSALRLADAEQHLQRALALNPNSVTAMFWQAMAVAWDSRPLDAMPLFARAGQLDPVNFLIHLLFAHAAADCGQYGVAREQIAQAQSLAPRHPNVARSFGALAYAQGDTGQAIVHYREAVALNAQRYDLHRELGWLLLDAGQGAEAMAAFARAIEAAPSLQFLVGEAGIAAVAAGDQSALARAIGQLQAVAPAEMPPGGQASLAWLHLLRGDAATALRLVEPVAGLIAGDPITLDGPWETFLGRSFNVDVAAIYSAAGQSTKSEPFLERTLAELERMERQHVVWHSTAFLKARVFALRSDANAALTQLERAAALGFRRHWWLPLDPALRSLRGNPRFAARVAARIK